MRILAIDTASPRPAVSLLAGETLIEEPLSPDRRSSEELIPAIARALAGARIRLQDCAHIAVCSGPGSFTGIRIGLATAWGLSRASGIPVETVSTLECLAEAARASGAASVTAVLDAGRGEVVAERYALDQPRARSLAPAARLTPDRIPDVALGSSVVALPAGVGGGGAVEPPTLPASALALATSRQPRSRTAATVRAAYARPSAAEEKHGAS